MNLAVSKKITQKPICPCFLNLVIQLCVAGENIVSYDNSCILPLLIPLAVMAPVSINDKCAKQVISKSKQVKQNCIVYLSFYFSHSFGDCTKPNLRKPDTVMSGNYAKMSISVHV